MQQDMARTVDQVKNAPEVSILYILDATDLNNPWTAGPGSFVGWLITMAGGRNIARQAPGAWTQLSIERIVSADPQTIVINASHGTETISAAELKAHPVRQKLTAAKQDRIYTVDGDLVNLPEPRIVRGLKAIAEILHPERFK
jgi:iron complex transport system substrate-binding protein